MLSYHPYKVSCDELSVPNPDSFLSPLFIQPYVRQLRHEFNPLGMFRLMRAKVCMKSSLTSLLVPPTTTFKSMVIPA
eukprot:scaffold78230_cov61-Attheya_sp.AAC.9